MTSMLFSYRCVQVSSTMRGIWVGIGKRAARGQHGVAHLVLVHVGERAEGDLNGDKEEHKDGILRVNCEQEYGG